MSSTNGIDLLKPYVDITIEKNSVSIMKRGQEEKNNLLKYYKVRSYITDPFAAISVVILIDRSEGDEQRTGRA